jgi:hypothetical protein
MNTNTNVEAFAKIVETLRSVNPGLQAAADEALQRLIRGIISSLHRSMTEQEFAAAYNYTVGALAQAMRPPAARITVTELDIDAVLNEATGDHWVGTLIFTLSDAEWRCLEATASLRMFSLDSVYPEIDRLVELGLLSHTFEPEHDDDGVVYGDDIYNITATGKAWLKTCHRVGNRASGDADAGP